MPYPYKYPYVEPGDYVTLKDQPHETWKVTRTNPTSFSCRTEWGDELHFMPYAMILDLLLESEVNYNF